MSGASKAGASVDGTPGVGEKTLADRGRRRRDRTDVVDVAGGEAADVQGVLRWEQLA